MRITGTVVTFNNINTIKKCISSLMNFTYKYSLEFSVFDNGSTDETVKWIQTHYPKIRVNINKENIGFGAAHNQILPTISDGYHFVINPDVFVDCDVISKMVDYLENHPDIGMLAPKVLNLDTSVQHLPKREPSIRYIFLSKLPFFHFWREEYTRENENLRQPVDIEFCTGCFFCIKSQVFKEMNGFDDKYFMYFEDADLTKRVKKKYRVVFNPDIYVYHEWKRENTKSCKGILRYLKSWLFFSSKWGWKL